MRIFIVPIYTSVVLSQTVCTKLYLFLVAFNVPVYSLFCCGAALFLLLWTVEPFFLLLWAVELLLRLVQLSFVEAVMARSVFYAWCNFFLQLSC